MAVLIFVCLHMRWTRDHTYDHLGAGEALVRRAAAGVLAAAISEREVGIVNKKQEPLLF